MYGLIGSAAPHCGRASSAVVRLVAADRAVHAASRGTRIDLLAPTWLRHNRRGDYLQFEMVVPVTQPLDGMSQSLLESTFVMTVAA